MIRVDGVQIDRSPNRARGEQAAVQESEVCWIPPGEPVRVASHLISGGMLYLGQKMGALSGWGADPALINPHLQIGTSCEDTAGDQFSYWPSYSDIPPTSRAAYLRWLAGGRRDPGIGIGYVFLFFYGIERRLLFDSRYSSRAREEMPLLLAEVEALLGLYGSNNSFRGYATAFLDYLRSATIGADIAALAPPTERDGHQIPFSVKLAVGDLVRRGEPIPAKWALPWLRLHPDTYLRTPGQRCPKEFDRLFVMRYRDAFGEGMRLQRNKSVLRLEYNAASSSLRGQAVSSEVGDIPDVTRLKAPLTRLQKIAEQVETELDGFSRWVGRTGDRTSPAALALLPPELIQDCMGEETRAFATWLERSLDGSDVGLVNVDQLIARWISKGGEPLTKKEACMLADLLGALGLGIEPDVRFGGMNLSRSEKVAVFRLPAGQRDTASADLTGMMVLLHVGSMVAAADGDVADKEWELLRKHVDQAPHLSEVDRVRLRAQLRWLLACPPSAAGLKKKMEALSPEERHHLGRFLLSLAAADGFISPDELKVLGKIYPLLGLNPDDLYADVHDMAAGAESGPTAVLPADPTSGGFTIPKPRVEPETAGAKIALNLDRVAAIRAETVEVTKVLGSIFSDDDPLEEVEGSIGEEIFAIDGGEVTIATLPGLDEPHSALVRALASRSEISYAGFTALAEENGLMAAGAIEVINDASFNACDEPLLEGEDPLEVNSYALEEMSA